jgi:hypothetical protein
MTRRDVVGLPSETVIDRTALTRFGPQRKTTSMVPCHGKKRFGKAAVILQLLLFGLLAFSLGPRISNPFASSLAVNDVAMVASSASLPTLALHRGAKTFPSEFRAGLFSAKVVQPNLRLNVAIVPDRHASVLHSSRFLSSIVIRAPPLA